MMHLRDWHNQNVPAAWVLFFGYSTHTQLGDVYHHLYMTLGGSQNRTFKESVIGLGTYKGAYEGGYG